MQDRHVFFLFFHLWLGGIQRKIIDLVYHLEADQNYYDIIPHIVVRRTEAFSFESDLPAGFRQLHIENVFPSKERKIRYIIFLIYLILEYNPKILVPFLHHATAYCVLMKYLFFWKKIKVVVSQDNVLSFENQLPYSIRTHSNIIISWCYRLVDTIIVQTEYAKQDLVKNYKTDPNKVVVIQNWIKDTRLYRQSKKYDLIYCGRFAPQKRLIKLLEIVKQIKLTLPKIKLCLIGEGPEEKKLRHYIKKHSLKDNIIIKPPTKKIITELSRAKLFTLTSDFEGHPLVLLEAMTQQVVPITLSYQGAEEYLEHGKNSYIEQTAMAMGKRIILLLQDHKKRQAVGQQARRTVLKYHNQSLIDKTLRVLLD
ncbi:glycosyltransferase [Patescibacteria group bacterium]|nr:glycosyltransferase [Patescibacteria group bacterium]